MRCLSRLLSPALLVAAGLNSYASTAGFITPSFRGSSGTEFGLWDNPNNFTVAYSSSLSAPGNVVNSDGVLDPGGDGNTDAVIRQLVGGAFITGGGAAGNIYSFGSVNQFVLSDVTSLPVNTVVFQVRTAGNELDYSSVKLSYDLGAGIQYATASRTELDRAAAGPGGFSVSSKWEFDLGGLGIQNYNIIFNASDVSLSLDSVALDTQFGAVPEPSTYAVLFSIGLGGFACWRRRGNS